MLKLGQHHPKFLEGNIRTLLGVKNTKKEVFDAMGIPVKEQISMFKKLRAMGVK